jgi:hypothetical protein
MPARLKLDARCPVCDEKIVAVCRVTSRTCTSLQFDHEDQWRGSHDLAGDDATMSTIFNRLSEDPTKIAVPVEPA